MTVREIKAEVGKVEEKESRGRMVDEEKGE